MSEPNGFAMADALIAMIIASLFAISLIGANTLMVRSIDNASKRLNATLLGRSLIENRPRASSGEVYIDGTRFGWTLNTEVDIRTRGELGFDKENIFVFISWSGLTTKQSVDISTVRLRRTDA